MYIIYTANENYPIKFSSLDAQNIDEHENQWKIITLPINYPFFILIMIKIRITSLVQLIRDQIHQDHYKKERNNITNILVSSSSLRHWNLISSCIPASDMVK